MDDSVKYEQYVQEKKNPNSIHLRNELFVYDLYTAFIETRNPLLMLEEARVTIV